MNEECDQNTLKYTDRDDDRVKGLNEWERMHNLGQDDSEEEWFSVIFIFINLFVKANVNIYLYNFWDQEMKKRLIKT